MPKVLCIFGVVLVCLHTITVVKTNPASRKSSSSLQRLKRNLTILARAFNVTQKFADYPKRSKFGNHCSKNRHPSVLDPYFIKAVATNTRKVMLFSKNKYLLQITNDGFVNGTQDVSLPTGVNDCSKNIASVPFLPICDKWRGNFDMSDVNGRRPATQ